MTAKITNDSIQFEQGGEIITIFKKYVQVIRFDKNAGGCHIHVKDFEDSYFANVDIHQINMNWGL